MTIPENLKRMLLEDRAAGDLKPELQAMTDDEFETWMEEQWKKEEEAEKRRDERGDLLTEL